MVGATTTLVHAGVWAMQKLSLLVIVTFKEQQILPLVESLSVTGTNKTVASGQKCGLP
jgi:hypothetical protein